MFQNSVNIAGESQKTFTVGGAYSQPLAEGVYDVWADSDIYIKVDAVSAIAAAVTTGTGYKISAGNVIPVRVVSPSFLGAAGTGSVYFHKVG